jgi:hypothetical protein
VGRSFGRGPGGIQALLAADRTEWEAIRADLLGSGFTLRDVPGRVSWADLVAMVRHAGPGSAIYRQRTGPDAAWTLDNQLAAAMVDTLNDWIWVYQMYHLGKGQPKPQRPQPIDRPGVKKRKDRDVQQIGSDPIPANQFMAWWNGSPDLEAKRSNEK